ncbi:MAG: Mg chelatase-related protein [Cyanobacteria bacterium RYN_339]|nr:Mg chelatase-related protein [Cyanobacteria bacterium RYN_339]
MLAKVASGAVLGIEAFHIEVEVDIQMGVPGMSIVGLGGTAIQEAKERVRSAIRNSGYEFAPRKVTINLAPANLKKEGPMFDLAIAAAILVASEQLNGARLGNYMIVGELSLDGRVRPISGVLPIALAARAAGFKGILVPELNAQEAALVEGLEVHPVENLAHAVAILDSPATHVPLELDRERVWDRAPRLEADFSEVQGQVVAKRGLELSAAGGHNVVLVGPPGSGKTMLARRLPGILPDLTFEEAIEITKLYSVAGLLGAKGSLIAERPFRSPHHSVSNAGLVGGTASPRPGEISLAHRGVLFLDELAEFRRDVVEQLRQPLEEGCITISRAQATVTYPADISLVAALNPCPCGYRGDSTRNCSCTPAMAARYWSKLSGPLLDRIDLHIEVPRLSPDELLSVVPAESSATIRARVMRARLVQAHRFRHIKHVYCNAQMGSRQLREHCRLDAESQQLLRLAINQLGLSGRSHNRILKLSRTIADLDGSESLTATHVSEAIQFRTLDRSVLR